MLPEESKTLELLESSKPFESSELLSKDMPHKGFTHTNIDHLQPLDQWKEIQEILEEFHKYTRISFPTKEDQQYISEIKELKGKIGHILYEQGLIHELCGNYILKK